MSMTETDKKFLRLAYEEALAGYNEGGCPIGSVLADGDKLIAQGRNQTFGGNEDLLRERGLEVVIADDPDCIALMTKFIQEKPELWNEDIAEE